MLRTLMKAPAFTISLLAFLSSTLFAQDYAIKLHRPEKAGNEYHYSVSVLSTNAMVLTVNGAVKKSDQQEMQAQFKGLVKILEINAAGNPKKVALTVEKFTIMEKGAISEALPPGTVIIGSVVANQKELYQVKGKPVEKNVADALRHIAGLDKLDAGGDEDEIFGTHDRKKKGDSWDIDGEKLVKSTQRTDGTSRFLSATGKATLEDVTGDSMTVSEHATAAIANFAPNLAMDQNAFDGTSAVTLPLDATKSVPFTEKDRTSINYAAHGQNAAGDVAVLKISGSDVTNKIITPK